MEEEVKPKQDVKIKLAHLKDHVGEYVNTYTQIAKAKAVRGASTATAGVVVGVTAFFFAFFFLFFVGFGLGWWLGNVLDSRAGGFFAVAGFFMLLCVLLFALRRKLITPFIRNMLISKIYE
ncbi:MAG TPA: phage holin family protein [Flavisolibacter sp.]|nr:phage holin family protein [Flavisolibacter sp.]